MAYQRDHNKKFRKSKSYMDETTYSTHGKPDGEGRADLLMAIKALKNLPKSSYALLADPYLAALPTSEPYPMLNVFNKCVGGTYGGDRNLDGGNVQQYANSITSKMLKFFDVFRAQVALNYRYLQIRDKHWTDSELVDHYDPIGDNLIDEMIRSVAESLSVLQSTTYTQMAINKFVIVTDMPMGSATTKNVAATGQTPINAYTDRTAVLYGMAVYYQIVLQTALNTFNWHNSFRLKQGTAIRNAWNREVPVLNSLFGLFNKKAFLSQLESLALIFEGEYLDLDFAKQASMLNVMPSRRSNAITDPVLELQTSFTHPSYFKVYFLDENGEASDDTLVYCDEENNAHDDMRVQIGLEGGVPVYERFWEAIENINDYLSLEATTRWARQTTNQNFFSGSDQARYNIVNRDLKVIIACMTRFKPSWADFREALDTVSRAGAIAWQKGFVPKVTKDTDAALFRNLIVDDIYQLIFSGASEIKFDDATKRWRTFSLWNMYTGIPEYDAKQGGAFLTYSFKKISGDADTDELVKYLPQILTTKVEDATPDVLCAAIARDGTEAVISTADRVMSDNMLLTRLVPLTSQNGLKIRMPLITFNNNKHKNESDQYVFNLSTAHCSALLKQMTQVFGMAGIQTANNGAYTYQVDPDILAVYQVEIEDTTNDAISYARANAPFRGSTSGEGILGFFGSLKSENA